MSRQRKLFYKLKFKSITPNLCWLAVCLIGDHGFNVANRPQRDEKEMYANYSYSQIPKLKRGGSHADGGSGYPSHPQNDAAVV